MRKQVSPMGTAAVILGLQSALLVVILLAFSLSVRAQSANGQVNGTVTDRSGAAISGARVRLTNPGTRNASVSETNPNGYFLFINVLPGTYVLSVNYNALQAQFERTFSAGLFLLASYTWSKCLGVSSGWFNVENGTNGGVVTENYFSQGLAYGPCGFDVPQDATVSVSYGLPFGRGKTYLTHGPLSWVLGNWETNLFLIGRSGQNFQITNGNGDPASLSGSGGIGKTSVSGYDRPDVVPGVGLVPAHRTASEWFNPAALCIIPSTVGQTVPKGLSSPICPAGSPVFGNLPPGSLRDQFFYNVDFSVAKNIRISEAKRLQLRAEAFNVLNLQILGTPQASITSGSPGAINSIASTPRELQFAGKFIF